MCKYCESNHSRASTPLFDKQDTCIVIFNNSLTIISNDKEGIWRIDLQINYCPMCGVRL